MTITPGERAPRVASEIEALCCDYVGVFFFKEELAARLISLAIREAEDAALEDAAAAASGAVLRAIDDGSPRGQVAVAAAFAVRALKHNKD